MAAAAAAVAAEDPRLQAPAVGDERLGGGVVSHAGGQQDCGGGDKRKVELASPLYALQEPRHRDGQLQGQGECCCCFGRAHGAPWRSMAVEA
ncbi:hypothetical protein MRX96_031997 [Rhipicephalus microplus]